MLMKLKFYIHTSCITGREWELFFPRNVANTTETSAKWEFILVKILADIIINHNPTERAAILENGGHLGDLQKARKLGKFPGTCQNTLQTILKGKYDSYSQKLKRAKTSAKCKILLAKCTRCLNVPERRPYW